MANRDGQSSSNPQVPSTVDKGPLLETLKDSKGLPMDPTPQVPLIKCYRYQGIGHKSNNCHKRSEVQFCDRCTEENYTVEEETDAAIEIEQEADEGNHLSCVLRRLCLASN